MCQWVAGNEMWIAIDHQVAALRDCCDASVLFFFAVNMVRQLQSRVLSRGMLHFGARPESFRVFETGLPLAKRGDSVFIFRHYRVSCAASLTPSR